MNEPDEIDAATAMTMRHVEDAILDAIPDDKTTASVWRRISEMEAGK